ncbi:MAG: hypothetical protein RL748_1680, partial [Pseudomonadota bacterium]
TMPRMYTHQGLIMLPHSVGLLLALAGSASAEPLIVSYIEKPPYYYTENNEAKGFLVKKAQQIFEQAGVPIQYVSRPAKRVLLEIELNLHPTCSIGWFKSPERANFARFSNAIHQDQPMAVLAAWGQAAELRKYATLRELTLNPKLRLGVVAGFSYGPYIDLLTRDMKDNIERSSSTPIFNLKKLAINRIDYTLIDVQELDYLSQQADIDLKRLTPINFIDIPQGNFRYLMCSKKVSDEVMGRLNSAIKALTPEEPAAAPAKS